MYSFLLNLNITKKLFMSSLSVERLQYTHLIQMEEILL